jgi:dTDP-4-dehydrorhamnose 3,5-epimerase
MRAALVKFVETELDGVFIIEPERRSDDRGFFARTFCRREFADRGLVAEVNQCSTSYNVKRGTLRGMHYQAYPHAETKLVRCTAGSVYDVVVDLRRDSSSCGRWIGVELSAADGLALYIPAGCAHGFQTLTDGAEVLYQISEPYVPELARGFRWNDPAFAIRWPIGDPTMSDRDRSYPDFAP